MSKTNAFLEWIYTMNSSEKSDSNPDTPIMFLAKLTLRIFNFREYVHDEDHAWKIIQDALSESLYPEIIVDLPNSSNQVTDRELAFAASFIMFIGYFNSKTCTLDQSTLECLSDKECLLICSVMYDISAYLAGVLNLKELRLNFMGGMDKFNLGNQQFLNLKNQISFQIDELKKLIVNFEESNKNLDFQCQEYRLEEPVFQNNFIHAAFANTCSSNPINFSSTLPEPPDPISENLHDNFFKEEIKRLNSELEKKDADYKNEIKLLNKNFSKERKGFLRMMNEKNEILNNESIIEAIDKKFDKFFEILPKNFEPAFKKSFDNEIVFTLIKIRLELFKIFNNKINNPGYIRCLADKYSEDYEKNPCENNSDETSTDLENEFNFEKRLIPGIQECADRIDSLLKIFKANDKINDEALNMFLLMDMNKNLYKKYMDELERNVVKYRSTKALYDEKEKIKNVLFIALKEANKRIEKQDEKYKELKNLYDSSRKAIENIKMTLKFSGSPKSVSKIYLENSVDYLKIDEDQILKETDKGEKNYESIPIQNFKDLKKNEECLTSSQKHEDLEIGTTDLEISNIIEEIIKNEEMQQNDFNCSLDHVHVTPQKSVTKFEKNKSADVSFECTPRTEFVKRITALNLN